MSDVRDAMPHTPEAHDVIACELTACILGQRPHADRLDLRVDFPGQMLRVGRDFAALQLQIGQRIVESIAPNLARLAALARDLR